MELAGYVPPPHEYQRPTGEYILPWTSPEGVDRHFVRGAFAHQENLKDAPKKTDLLFELVPEPGNPFDPSAVAFHLNGKRVGYVSREYAPSWHEYVAGHNRLGRAVYAHGVVTKAISGTDRVATVYLGWRRLSHRFRMDSGVPAICRNLIEKLPSPLQYEAMLLDQSVNFAPVVIALNELKHLAPFLVWPDPSTNELPAAINDELVVMGKERREKIGEERELERARIRELKELARIEARRLKAEMAESERQLRRRDIVELFNQGLSRTAIVEKLHTSTHAVNDALQASGNEVLNQNHEAALYRLGKALDALDLQRGGLTRKEIGERLGYSVDSLKRMLKDAKFIEDPASDPVRFAQVQTVNEVRQISTLSNAATLLHWPISKVKEARRDAWMIEQVPKLKSRKLKNSSADFSGEK